MVHAQRQVSMCSKTWIPDGFQGIGYIGRKLSIMVTKGIRVIVRTVGSTDWWGLGRGLWSTHVVLMWTVASCFVWVPDLWAWSWNTTVWDLDVISSWVETLFLWTIDLRVFFFLFFSPKIIWCWSEPHCLVCLQIKGVGMQGRRCSTGAGWGLYWMRPVWI